MIQTINAWSISRLLEFEQCPQRSYLRHIAKSELPELPQDHPMMRGQRIHAEVEAYIEGSTDVFPSSGKKLRGVLDYCREQYVEGTTSVEEKWGFDKEWQPTDWFSSDVWVRMATDCAVNHDNAVEIYDWKTGKSFGNEVKYMQQMQLYAVGGFLQRPEVENIDVRLGFLDDGKVREKNFQRGKKINILIARFTERGLRMTECVDFRPRPSAVNCKYCPFGPSNGTGACVYGVAA